MLFIIMCRNLTIRAPKESVKRFVTMILDDRLVLIIKAGQKEHASVQ